LNLSQFLSGEQIKKQNKEQLVPFYTPVNDEDRTLVFESRFESGNLWMALKLSDFEYDLILSTDTNSKGNTQWFYFQVSNTTAGLSVKFNIVNLCKSGSLYNHGMKICYRQSQGNWKRGGSEIHYFPNNFKRNSKGRSFYTLTFTHHFEKTNETLYFAYSQPYTYSNQMDFLKTLETDPFKKKFINRKLLSHSISGNRCEVLTITSPGSPEETKTRKIIIISSRVHPGETVSSFMMHGFLDFLTSNTSEAILLRENFVFKVIPMLNPDGVINGNYRSNLAGADLNRRWQDPLKSLHPTIFALKKMIRVLNRDRQVELICDLHGHSRRQDVFMYGCDSVENPRKARAYPFILSSISRCFNYRYCCFRMQRSKESTMRVALFQLTRIPCIYTLEASFAGCDFGSLKGMHMTAKDLQNLGKELCLTILIKNNISSSGCSASILKNFEENKDFVEDNQDSSGSDSDPSEDEISKKQLMKLLTQTKVKSKKPPLPEKSSISPTVRTHPARYLSIDFQSRSNIKNLESFEEDMKNNQNLINPVGRKQLVLPKPNFLISRTRDNSVSKGEAKGTFFPRLELTLSFQRKKEKSRSSQTEFPAISLKREEKVLNDSEKTKSSKIKFEFEDEKPRPVCKYSLFTYQYSFI
jgi:hypothetical protein